VNTQMLDNLLNVREVSKMLNLHPNTVRHWCDQGTLPCLRIGPRGDRRFRQEDIKGYLDDLKVSRQRSGYRGQRHSRSRVKESIGSL
jgi:excisionase family DNA binding protein